MNGLIKRAQEETGLGEDSSVIDQFSQTQEQVIATTLQDWESIKERNSGREEQYGENISCLCFS